MVNRVDTKDKWMIMAMVASGLSPTEIRKVIDEMGRPIMYWVFEGEDAVEIERKKNFNLPIFVELSKLESADRMFKNNMNRLKNEDRAVGK